jgi:hypothetical protein
MKKTSQSGGAARVSATVGRRRARRSGLAKRKARIKLTDPQKIYVVRRLAAYDSLAVIVRGLKDEFGITVRSGLIQHYDPQRPAGRHLAPRLKKLFWDTRKTYIDGTADIGAGYPPVRIRWRGEMVQETWGKGQHKIANEILDSIAKEAGGAPGQRNTQGHFGLCGGPLTATVNIVHRHEPASRDAPAVCDSRAIKPGKPPR